MKNKIENTSVVQDLCRKLKLQLDELSVRLEPEAPKEDERLRSQLMERLKAQLAELST